MVGRSDLTHAEPVVGSVHDLDGVAGGERAGAEDTQVGAWPAGRREAAGEGGVAHADAELVAGHARLGDLKQRGHKPPAVADSTAAGRLPAHGAVIDTG